MSGPVSKPPSISDFPGIGDLPEPGSDDGDSRIVPRAVAGAVKASDFPLKPPPFRSTIFNHHTEVQRRIGTQVDQRKGPFVQYVGPCAKRSIAPHEWRSILSAENIKEAGVIHEWNTKNKKMIPVAAFSDHQLDYLLVEDMQKNGGHSFLEVDYNENGQLVQIIHNTAANAV